MVNVLLLDDHSVVRTGYRRLIDAEPDLRVVAEAATAGEAYARLQEGRIDLVVVDISLRGTSGIDAIRRILSRDPQIRVLVLSMHDNPNIVTQAMRAGALGYLTKSSEPSELLDGIRAVARGRRVLSTDVAQMLAEASLDGEQVLSRLTPREFEVLRMLASGEETREIATHMHLSPKTIHNHLSMVRQKLETDSDIKLLRLAVRHGLVDLQAMAV
ncbi:response regulator [Hydrogenophaga palleronii]|uniref:response regulator n=1 Tax=Hydrogenophaga palleronii TaxID=65655 RepID=UPI000AA9BE90|nr:response regulator transcription factor [Hydrogenophaga palleronii]